MTAKGSDDKVPVKLPETFFLLCSGCIAGMEKTGDLGEFRLLGASLTGM